MALLQSRLFSLVLAIASAQEVVKPAVAKGAHGYDHAMLQVETAEHVTWARFSGLDCVKQVRASDAQCIPCKKKLPDGSEVNRFQGNCKRDATVLASQIFTPWHVCGNDGQCPQGRLPKFRGRLCWAFNRGEFSRYHGPAGVCIKQSWHSRHIPTVTYAKANMAHGWKNVADFVAAYQWSMEQRESWNRTEMVMTCQLFCGEGIQACGKVGDCTCGELCAAQTATSATQEPTTTEVTEAGMTEDPTVAPEPSTTKKTDLMSEEEGDGRSDNENRDDLEGNDEEEESVSEEESPSEKPEPPPELTSAVTTTEQPEPSATKKTDFASEEDGDARGDDENRDDSEGDDDEDEDSVSEEPEPTPELTSAVTTTEEPEPLTAAPTPSPTTTKLVGKKQKCISGKIRFQRGVGDQNRCMAMCEAHPACRFYTSYNRGGCVIWSRCDGLQYSKAGTTYARS